MDDYKDFIAVMLKRAAGEAINQFGKVAGATKGSDNNQVLTETDTAIGNMIVAAIKEKYQSHSIIDEESGVVDNQSQYTWVIDPIDGTSNFANGVPLFGIMIGLLDGATPIVGGIMLPMQDQLFLAVKGQGATCNEVPIKVTTETNLLNALVAYGVDGYQNNPIVTRQEMGLLGEIVLGIRNLRTSNSAFDQTMVARGCYGAALNHTSRIWDNVAQQIIIEEAGGLYTDFYGKPIDYTDPIAKSATNFTFCAGAPALHQQLQQIITAQTGRPAS